MREKVDFNVKNREEVYQEIYDEVEKKYKDYHINITLDVDISDQWGRFI